MKIQTFRNMKGMIYGRDPNRISSKKSGVLVFGNTEIKILADESVILPPLYYGTTGKFSATFTTDDGEVYTIDKIIVKSGRIVPPSNTEVEIMTLHCRADEAEAERDDLKEKIRVLEGIFDTNSLNFLIY